MPAQLLPHRCLQGLSDARQRCAFFAARENSGNGLTACGGTEAVAS